MAGQNKGEYIEVLKKINEETSTYQGLKGNIGHTFTIPTEPGSDFLLQAG